MVLHKQEHTDWIVLVLLSGDVLIIRIHAEQTSSGDTLMFVMHVVSQFHEETADFEH